MAVDGWTAAYIGFVAVGFVVLNQGAKFLCDNAVGVAGRLGRSRFVVGALLVSTLAALPELLVSTFAIEQGSEGIALGNALASIVVTLAFVIGLSAVIRPIRTNREVVLRDGLFLATVTVVAAALLLDGDLTMLDGLALIALFVPYVVGLLITQRKVAPAELDARVEEMKIELTMAGWIFGRKVEIRAGLRWLVFGILWTVMGAQFMVLGAIGVSRSFGISEWIIGITVVAIGTSLPDIAAAYHATRRGYSDLALGEGVGACVVTALLTLGVIGLLRPLTFSVTPILPVIIVTIGTTYLLLGMMLGGWQVSRRAGLALMGSYVLMIALNAVLIASGQ